MINERHKTVFIVVPCFNEESRWNSEYWEKVSAIKDLRICFVNDGSTDGTLAKIKSVSLNSNHTILDLPTNCGKAEAIRLGLQSIIKYSPLGVGYLDADGAFSVRDIDNQISVFRNKIEFDTTISAVWSSRINLAGRNINRKTFRHYIARLLAKLFSLFFKYTIYDTQSGLKIFYLSNKLEACFRDRFTTRWFVDLEIYLRWRSFEGKDMRIWEEPLWDWQDIENSKITLRHYSAVFRDILKLARYGWAHN